MYVFSTSCVPCWVVDISCQVTQHGGYIRGRLVHNLQVADKVCQTSGSDCSSTCTSAVLGLGCITLHCTYAASSARAELQNNTIENMSRAQVHVPLTCLVSVGVPVPAAVVDR
jgi:hypothetical protein